MKKTILGLLSLAIILSFALTACTRTATNAPAEPKSAEAESPIGPLATQPDTINESMQATQAAMSAADNAETAPDANVGGGAPTVEAPTATSVPTATKEAFKEPAKPESYVLQKGEFPYCIARRYNVSIASLLNANGLSTNSLVGPGTKLVIPQSGSWDSGSRQLKSHPATYTVNSGDTVYSIACLYGDVYPEAIIYENNLDSAGTIQAGATLNIP